MKEFLINFPPAESPGLFAVDLAGITYPDETYRIHRENSFCMVVEYVIRGRGTVLLDGQPHEVGAGDIYLLPDHRDHLYYAHPRDPWEKIWFNATGSLVSLLLQEYNPREQVVFRNAGGREFFDRMLALGQDSGFPARQKHQQGALLFHSLLQHLQSQCNPRAELTETGTVKEYIDCHYTENLSLAGLSQLVYLSPSQLVRIFKRDLGVTPYEYCLELKLRQARNLLLNTNLLVKEISASLGFCDEHYFSYLFRKKIGKSPVAYRKSPDFPL